MSCCMRSRRFQKMSDEKRSVWGPTRHGRLLQVIFVHVVVEDTKLDEYARLQLYERIALDAGEPAVRIIHARELTNVEKKQLRRRTKGRL